MYTIGADSLDVNIGTLKIGSKGIGVVEWQKLINRVSGAVGFAPIKADGDFGVGTKAATVMVQRSIGVASDGIVGQGTLKAFATKWPMLSTAITMPKHDVKLTNDNPINHPPRAPSLPRKTPAGIKQVEDAMETENKGDGKSKMPVMLIAGAAAFVLLITLGKTKGK